MRVDDDAARRRLWQLTLLRLACFGVFLLGIAIIYTDIARPGGWPQLGAIICIVAAVAPLAITFALKRRRDRERP
jgi:O-antigen/teichoic acid export membrane protein